MRFGLLGTGYWADVCHATGIVAHPKAELVGVWGRDFAKAEMLAAKHGTKAESDLDALLANVDAVAIALPPDIQVDLACRAAKAGRHLLLEKPIALTDADARRVAEAAERAAVSSVVFFTSRFNEPVASWLDGLEPLGLEGGQVTMLTTLLTTDGPFSKSPWRREYGALWDIGPHALSILEAGLGRVVEVSAQRGPGDAIQVMLIHERGGASAATLSFSALPSAAHYEVQFWGPQGFVTPPSGGKNSGSVEAFKNAISALIESAETRVPNACDVRYGEHVVRTLSAAERFTRRPAGERSEAP